jgi:hypothetical protein
VGVDTDPAPPPEGFQAFAGFPFATFEANAVLGAVVDKVLHQLK